MHPSNLASANFRRIVCTPVGLTGTRIKKKTGCLEDASESKIMLILFWIFQIVFLCDLLNTRQTSRTSNAILESATTQ
jgi:hypothetical protein